VPDDNSHRLQHWVHWTLLVGLAASAVLLTCGLAAMLGQGHQQTPRHESLGTLGREAARFHGPAITTLGLLVLMITPVMRVVVLLVGWALRRDWLFAAVAFVVLGLLVLSLSLGVG
jgi:uncharacterized membrane protein